MFVFGGFLGLMCLIALVVSLTKEESIAGSWLPFLLVVFFVLYLTGMCPLGMCP